MVATSKRISKLLRNRPFARCHRHPYFTGTGALRAVGACLKVERAFGACAGQEAYATLRLRHLPQLTFYFPEPIRAFEDVAGLAAVGRADDAVALHHIENARGAA